MTRTRTEPMKEKKTKIPQVDNISLYIYIYTKQNYFHTYQFICNLEYSVPMTDI